MQIRTLSYRCFRVRHPPTPVEGTEDDAMRGTSIVPVRCVGSSCSCEKLSGSTRQGVTRVALHRTRIWGHAGK